MTTYFVSSVTGDNSTGTSWTTAKTSVTAALAIPPVDGDIILVDHSHSVNAGAAITWTIPTGNIAIISVTPSGASSYSAFTAGGAETVGAANAAFTVTPAAGTSLYLFGMSLTSGTTSGNDLGLFTSSNIANWRSLSCTFAVPGAGTGSQILLASGTASGTIFDSRNDTYLCSGSRAGTFITFGSGQITLTNPTISLTGGTKPAVCFDFVTLVSSKIVIQDADLTGYAVTSGAYFNIATIFNTANVVMRNCKISATPTLTTGTFPSGNASFTLRNVDSGNTDYIFQYTNFFGTLTADASVSKSGGASFNGTPISWKIVTTANANEGKPFVTPPMLIWDATTTSQTPNISIAQASGATNLTDRNIWPTQDFAASASATNYTFQSGRNAQPFIGSAVDWPADSGPTWSGISTPNKQLLSAGAFTAARAGLVAATISVGIATTTLYIGDAAPTGIT